MLFNTGELFQEFVKEQLFYLVKKQGVHVSLKAWEQFGCAGVSKRKKQNESHKSGKIFFFSF